MVKRGKRRCHVEFCEYSEAEEDLPSVGGELEHENDGFNATEWTPEEINPDMWIDGHSGTFQDRSGNNFFSPEQLQALEGHLAHRWGLDLPEGHPHGESGPSEMSHGACRIDTECEVRQDGLYYTVNVIADAGHIIDTLHTVNYEQSLEAEGILAQIHGVILPEDHPHYTSTVRPEYRIDTECVHADGINWYIVRVFNQNGDMIERRQLDSRDNAIEAEMIFAERYNTTPPPAYPVPRQAVRHGAEECDDTCVYTIDPDDDATVHVFDRDVHVSLPPASEVGVGRTITIVNRGTGIVQTHVSDGNEWNLT